MGKKGRGRGKKKEVEKHNRGTTNEVLYSGQKFRVDLLLFLALILNSKSVISLDALNIFFSITKHVGNSNIY